MDTGMDFWFSHRAVLNALLKYINYIWKSPVEISKQWNSTIPKEVYGESSEGKMNPSG